LISLLITRFWRATADRHPVFGGAQNGVSEHFYLSCCRYHPASDKSSIDTFVANSGELLLWLKQQDGRISINLTQTHHPMPHPSQDSSLQYDNIVAAPPERASC
jgi:hypothetical protein